jgi:hypothetical protein
LITKEFQKGQHRAIGNLVSDKGFKTGFETKNSM